MATISVDFNGQTIDVPPETSVSQLLRIVEMRQELVAVEVNQEIVPREEHPGHLLKEGDVIEAVTLVGGG